MSGAVADTLPRPDAIGQHAVNRPKSRHRVLRRFFRNYLATAGAIAVAIFTVLAIAAPFVAPYDPLHTDWGAIRQPPSALHWLGTDEIGRDLLSRLIYGGQASLIAGVVSVLIAIMVGVQLGIIAGYVGGFVEILIARLTDAMLAVPQIMLAIALATFLGASLMNATIAIGVSTVPIFIRLARSQTLSVKVEPYVEAARAIGNGHLRILHRYIVPNIVPAIIVQASLSIAVAIIAEAGLSFLGLGRRPPEPSWGTMLQIGKDYLHDAPWMTAAPGVCIVLVVLGFNLMGDGLRQALDPRRN